MPCHTNVWRVWNKKLSCRRQTARRFLSLNSLLSLKVIQGHSKWRCWVGRELCKSLLVFHWNYLYRLLFVRYSESNNGVTLKSGVRSFRVRVVQGRWLVKHIYCYVQRENSATFFDFWISQGIVATYNRWFGNLCGVYIENFLKNRLVKEFWKSIHVCQSYYQTSNFFETVYFQDSRMKTKAPFIATRLNSTSSWSELCRYEHLRRRCATVADRRRRNWPSWAAYRQSARSRAIVYYCLPFARQISASTSHLFWTKICALIIKNGLMYLLRIFNTRHLSPVHGSGLAVTFVTLVTLILFWLIDWLIDWLTHWQ